MTARKLRRDAAENRHKLIEAASSIMREQDGDVALEAIAERAGVTRGTVYRNFEDRFQLYTAVLDHEIDRIRQAFEADQPCHLFDVMRRLIALMDVYEKFQAALPCMAGVDDTERRIENLRALVKAPLQMAKAAGLLRPDATEEEILLACRMVASGWRLDRQADRATALDNRFRLILRGLQPARPAEPG